MRETDRHRTPPRRATFAACALALAAVALAFAAAGARATSKAPPGTHHPGRAAASQIIKYSGFTVNCVVIDVDDTAPKWAYVTPAPAAQGCGAGFKGFAIVHETAPQNVDTVGIAWTPVVHASSADCPLAKVPAVVVRTFELCTSAAAAAASPNVTRSLQLRRCAGRIHAGFTAAERRPALHFARYRMLSCARARAIVRIVDHVRGSYPAGYFWMTPVGDPPQDPVVFGHRALAFYLSPDGLDGTRNAPGFAVAIYR